MARRTMLMDKKSYEELRHLVVKIELFLRRALDKVKNKLILYMSGGEK